ncbi:DNA polymerase III subunit chi [Herbaspirillum sp. RTI4]|uniref:DNA polymerase III subunit chi n=1 Tax=Herbaspirillum sp. RTI4 TaxID=3048640 RepID=UPI002AB36AEA|nr:DNA polymerase III subunit chi [Herbaspirillum sp. RTI4]MDY7577992.1 DNA polymerase III subunit chi [Herbaspirillum sp. RTI4]MEA9982078.1 DNA polymerase III subunit chi [Herbaspirillum sp. RTI4]
MTRIDFHSNIPDKLHYACRLVRKARQAQCQVVVLTSGQAQMAALDKALWTFSEADFLPHVAATDPLAAHTPILLTDDDQQELPHHQILINLTTATPQHFARFERLFEIVASDENDKAAGRDRYRFYKERGYPLTHIVAAA